MECSVYQSKIYSLVMMVFVLAFAAVAARFLPHGGSRADVGMVLMRWAFAVLLSVCLVALIHALVTTRLVLRVDEAGIHYPRGWIPVIAWADVIAVERPPKVQRVGSETQHHLRDAWRPLNITVRNPDRYLLKLQKVLRAKVPALVRDADRTVIEIPFMGLTPGSDVVEACIRQHLTRLGVVSTGR